MSLSDLLHRRSPEARAILVVEDEPRVAEVLAEVFRSQGHEVDTARSGAVALAHLDRATYDVIVCDLYMPEMDGPTFYREAVRRHPACRRRFVFITGSGIGQEMEQFLRQTEAPYLRKPFDLDEIVRVVRQLAA